MKKPVLKILSILLILFTIASLGFVSVPAAVSYTNTKGSVKVLCGSYKKTFTAKKYNNNFSRALAAALDTARKKATAKTPARVVIAKGYYKLDRTVKVYSNTTLVATGSKFRYCGNLLRNGFDKLKGSGYGYTSARNITIKGGEWEQLVDYKYAGSPDDTRMHSTFRFAHCYNIKVLNASFKNNYNCHDIEIAGVKNSEFYNNTFYNIKSVNGISNNGGRESFQIDVNTSSAMPYFPSYDKTPCKNINIHHNTFKNKFRAIGSHHAVIGKTYNNISVHHNKMTNIAGLSVYAVYWTNSKIYSNTMSDVGFGVDLRSMIGGGALNFYNLNKLSYNDSEKAVVNSKTYIYDNTIQIRTDKNILAKTCGVRVLGDYYAKDDKTTGTKAGVYKIYNVNVGVDASGQAYPNRISGNLSAGVQISYGVNTVIKNNIIDLNNSSMSSNSGIELRGCDNTLISSNSLLNGKKSGAKGINAYESADGTFGSLINVSDNQINGFEYAGVFVKKASAVNITNNSITNCLNSSIALKAVTESQITNNSLSDGVYGISITDNCDSSQIMSNTVTASQTGLNIVCSGNVTASGNSFTGKQYGVYLKTTDKINLNDNTVNSSLYGVRLDKDCYSCDINSNTVNSDDECVYYSGSSSSDKSVIKSLSVTGNTLNCPADKAGVRVVYDNVYSTIHSNNRLDQAVPYYRFKGDNETKYRRQTGDMKINSLSVNINDGVTEINWSSVSKPDGCLLYSGDDFIGEYKGTGCVLETFEGQSVTAVPYKAYGNITHLGVPMTVSVN